MCVICENEQLQRDMLGLGRARSQSGYRAGCRKYICHGVKFPYGIGKKEQWEFVLARGSTKQSKDEHRNEKGLHLS